MKNTTPDMNHKAAGIPKPIPNANTQQVKLMENVASKWTSLNWKLKTQQKITSIHVVGGLKIK